MQRVPLIAAAFLAAPAVAQEAYWIETGGQITEITPSGDTLRTWTLTGAAGGANVAPDGKIWCPIRFSSDVAIIDPATGAQRTVTTFLGWTIDVAFDSSGHAWVSGTAGNTTLADGVEEFDANGNSQNTYPTVADARDITIDSNNNKWIAHRSGPPGSITHIDGMTGAITNIPMPVTSLILPIGVWADDRGLGNQSHIWITGDNRGAGELIEYDPTTNPPTTNVYNLDPAGRFGAPVATSVDAVAMTGTVWVGDWGNGNLREVDPFTGVARNVYMPPSGVISLAFDGFGRLWLTGRTASVLQRVDQATGALEVPVALGSVRGPLGTRYHYAKVVDPLGDLDVDGVPNTFELNAGTSPFDPWSNSLISVTTNGTTQIGSTCAIDISDPMGALPFWLLAFSPGLVAPGTGFTWPGLAGELLLDPTVALAGTVSGVGSASLPLTIPNVPGLMGYLLHVQGFGSAATAQFTNITSFLIW